MGTTTAATATASTKATATADAPKQGFFRTFFRCVPQTPNDAGVVVDTARSSARDVAAAAAAAAAGKNGNPKATAVQERSNSRKDATVATTKSPPKKKGNAAIKPTALPSMNPVPPSEEETPIASNRKAMNSSSTSPSSTSGNKVNNETTFLSSSSTKPWTSTKKTKNTIIQASTAAGSEPAPSPASVDKATGGRSTAVSRLIEEMNKKSDAPPKNASAAAAVDQQQQQRKAYPSFINKHPVHEKLKAKHDLFESAAAAAAGGMDATEHTQDLTESSRTSDVDDIITEAFVIVKRVPSHEDPVVNLCADDPWESAYVAWYRHGLLQWRPQSISVTQESGQQLDTNGTFGAATTTMDPEKNIQNSMTDSATPTTVVGDAASNILDGAKDFTIAERSKNITVGSLLVDGQERCNEESIASWSEPAKASIGVAATGKDVNCSNNMDITNEDMNRTTTADEDDAAALLHKYRTTKSAAAATICANCDKDVSLSIKLVRCTQCHQELYCSVFCRGNDRYNHAVRCTAQNSTNATTATPSTTAEAAEAMIASSFVVASSNNSDLSSKDVDTCLELNEEKKEDSFPALTSSPLLIAKEVDTSLEVAGESDNNVSIPVAVQEQVELQLSPKSTTRAIGPAVNVESLTKTINHSEIVYETLKEGSVQSTQFMKSRQTDILVDANAIVTSTKSTLEMIPKSVLLSDLASTSSSRSSSLRKSKQAPLVSLFGTNHGNKSLLSPRRLSTEMV